MATKLHIKKETPLLLSLVSLKDREEKSLAYK